MVDIRQNKLSQANNSSELPKAHASDRLSRKRLGDISKNHSLHL